MSPANDPSGTDSRQTSGPAKEPTDASNGRHLTKLLLDGLPHPAMLIHRNQTIVAANRMAVAVGAVVGDLCWRSFGCSEFIPGDDKHYINAHAGSIPPGGTKCTFCRCDEAFAAGRPTMAPAVAAFGRLWDTHWVPLEDNLYLHYAIDVTAHEQAKSQLVSAQARLDGILKAAPVGIGLVKDRVFQWVSPGFSEMLGLAAEDLIGQNARLVYPNDAEFERVGREKYRQIAAKGIGEIETRMLCKNGTLIEVLLRSTALDKTAPGKGVIFTALDIGAHKRAQAALRRSRRYYRSILNSLQEDVVVIDRDYRIVDLNDGVLAASGFTREEVVGRHCYEVLHGSSLPCREHGEPCELETVFATGRPVRCTHRHRKKDGTELWMDISFSAVKDAHGSILQVIETARDITELVRSKEQLKRKNVYLNALHEITIGILQRRDLQKLLQSIVRQAVKLTEVPNGFLLLYEPQADVLVMEAGHGIYADMLGRKIRPGEGLSGRVWQSGKSAVLTDYPNWPERIPDPRLDVVKCLLATPLKLEERIVGVLGLSHHASGRQLDNEIVKNIEPFAELAVVAIDNARLVSRLTTELRHRSRMEDERRRMEAQLRQAQKMEAIGTLAGGIAHDFNNILSAIIGFTELAADDAPPGSRQQQNLAEVLAAGSRATDLVRQILTFSRRSEQEFKPIDIAPVIKESLKLLQASLPAGITIRRYIGSDLAYVLADPVQIHQIMMNLGTNAAHAMENQESGILEVTLEETELNSETAARFMDLSPGNFLKLTVADSGCGMTSEVVANIFDPYFTTKPKDKGTGLGLAVVHGIVKSCRGMVTVSSRPGEGAVFEIYLPAVAPQKRGRQPSLSELPHGRESVLFVDDEPALATIGAHRLERLGYRVTVRSSPLEALELVRAAPQRFDLVITDLGMPHMRGTRLAAAIGELRPDLPVILCTGFSEKLSAEKAQQMGLAALLMKPVGQHELAVTVRRVLDREKASSAD